MPGTATEPDRSGDERLTVAEVASWLGLSYRSVYRRIDLGELRVEHDRNPWTIRRSEVTAYLERTRVRPGTLSHLTRRPRPSG